VKKVLERTRDAYDTFTEAVEKLKPFFSDDVSISPEFWSRLEDMRSYEILTTFVSKLEGRDIDTPEKVKALAKEIQKELGVKPKEIWHSLRIALTGQLEGVGIDILLSTLPKEKIVGRILKVLERLS